jgi:hypothetical protein
MSPLDGTQSEPEALSQSPSDGRPDFALEEYERLVASWLRPSRRRPDFPGRNRLKARLAALHYIVAAFEAGVCYTESDVNVAIRGRNPFDIDHVQPRRMMVDYAMLDRAANGTRYRRVHGCLALFNWDPAIPGTRPFHSEGQMP